MPTTTKTTTLRRGLRLMPVLAVLAGSAAWAPSSSAQPVPPFIMEFTVTPDEFESGGTFTVTIEGTGCVDPEGATEGPLTAVFFLQGGAVGSGGVDQQIGEFEVAADGSYSGSSDVEVNPYIFPSEFLPAPGLVYGWCTRNWPPTDTSDIVGSGSQEITIVAPPKGEPIGSLPPLPTATTSTEPSVPNVTTPLEAAQGAQPVASSPAYTG